MELTFNYVAGQPDAFAIFKTQWQAKTGAIDMYSNLFVWPKWKTDKIFSNPYFSKLTFENLVLIKIEMLEHESEIATGNIILLCNIRQTQKETNLLVLSFFYVSLLTRQEADKNWFFSSCKAYNIIFIVPLQLLTAFCK